MINEKRLSETFCFLVGIDSVSKKEGVIAKELADILRSLGCAATFDRSSEKTGSDTGNLVAKFPGRPHPDQKKSDRAHAEPLLLNAHMDTVSPGENIKINFSDGIFSSQGDTILGADDKSGLAILIETLRIIRERDLPSPPLEIVFTVCEEIGLLGAKHLDYSLLSAKRGYCLDTTDIGIIVTRAPAANRLTFKIHGKAAHAGISPENGINAIALAARAISNFDQGRLDPQTTCNIGRIQGGTAENIVPDFVTVRGEARSHDLKSLDAVTRAMTSAFETVVAHPSKTRPGDLPILETHVENDFPHTRIPEDHPVIETARNAALKLGRKLTPTRTGGGSDANIFSAKAFSPPCWAWG